MKFQEANECSIHDVHQVKCSTEGHSYLAVLGVGFIKQYLSLLLFDALKVKIDDFFFVFRRNL